MVNQQEIQEIVEGCTKQKRKHQQKLFEIFYGKMMGICLRYAKDSDEAKDMVQNGFIKVFEKIGSYNFTGSLEGWIRRIVVNTAIDQVRKNKNNIFSIEEIGQIKNLEEEVPFNIEEEEIEEKFKAEKVIDAINSLPPGYRTIFNLYVVEGYTHKEIADYLKVSEGTSKSSLARAKEKLRKILA